MRAVREGPRKSSGVLAVFSLQFGNEQKGFDLLLNCLNIFLHIHMTIQNCHILSSDILLLSACGGHINACWAQKSLDP